MVATMKKHWFFLGFFMVFRNAMHQCPADLYLKNDLKIALKTTQNSIPEQYKIDQKVASKQSLFFRSSLLWFFINILIKFRPFWDQNRPKSVKDRSQIAQSCKYSTHWTKNALQSAPKVTFERQDRFLDPHPASKPDPAGGTESAIKLTRLIACEHQIIAAEICCRHANSKRR